VEELSQSQFHFGSIQTGKVVEVIVLGSKSLNSTLVQFKLPVYQDGETLTTYASQFHFGSIQTKFKGGKVQLIGLFVSIPLWFNSNLKKAGEEMRRVWGESQFHFGSIQT